MKLKPLGDRVIVRTVDQEDVTASGIVLPDAGPSGASSWPSATAASWTAIGSSRCPMATRSSTPYGGTEVKLDGEDVLILNESDILARIGAKAKAPAKRTASRKPAAKKATAKKK